MIENIVMTMYPIVCDMLKCRMPADIQAVASEEYDVGLGMCKFVGGNTYQIHYHPSCPNIPLLICHELVHVVQHLRGDEFNYDLPYAEQPHEIEAYALEQELLRIYEASIK